MVPSTNQQRFESLERSLEDVRAEMEERVTAAVNRAASGIQNTMVDTLASTVEQVMKRMESSMVKSREEQDSFRKEMMLAMATLKVTGATQCVGASSTAGHESGLTPGIGSGSGRTETGSGRVGNQSGGNWKVKKLDLPIFDGNNPDGWILRAERYFHFYRLGEEETMEAAVVSLDGDALLWYQFEHGRRPIRNWAELKGMLLRQFRSSSTGSLQEQWLHHQQTGGVAEYRRRFIELIAPLTGVPEDIALAQFINGLRDEIKTEVRVLGALNLEHAMELALKVEEKLRSGGTRKAYGAGLASTFSGNFSSSSPKSQWSSPGSSRSVSVYSSSSHSPSSQSPRSISGVPVAKPLGDFRRLNDKELQAKRERGECFRCEEKWSAGHRCKKRELSVILMQGEGEGGEDDGVSEDDVGCEEYGDEPKEAIQSGISLNSVVGISSPKTMKLMG